MKKKKTDFVFIFELVKGSLQHSTLESSLAGEGMIILDKKRRQGGGVVVSKWF